MQLKSLNRRYVLTEPPDLVIKCLPRRFVLQEQPDLRRK